MAEHVNAATASYGDGWMVHVDAVRREAVGCADRERCRFPDPVSALVDETRRARYTATAEHYETDAVLTLPGALTKRMERAVIQGRGRPLEMAFLGTLPGRSADETVRKAARLAEAEGDLWPAEWLRLCGLDAEARALADPHEGSSTERPKG